MSIANCGVDDLSGDTKMKKITVCHVFNLFCLSMTTWHVDMSYTVIVARFNQFVFGVICNETTFQEHECLFILSAMVLS